MFSTSNWQPCRHSLILVLIIIRLFISVSLSYPAQLPAETISNLSKLKTIAYANDTTTAILQSRDGNYQWKFIKYNVTNSSSGDVLDRRLLVVVNTQFNTTVVWIANRNTPVSTNATLSVDIQNSTTGARIILADPTLVASVRPGMRNDSVVGWSTPAGVHTVQMNSSGNLIMWDSLDKLLWQSFDYTTDVMVPGQFMRTGHNATAYLAPNDVTAGHYTVRVESGGTVLYASFDEQQKMVPYHVFSYITGLFGELNETLYSPCNHTMMLYSSDATGLYLQQLEQSSNGSLYVHMTPECQADDTHSSHGFNYEARLNSEGFRYFRYTHTGDINAFLLDSRGLRIENELIRNFVGTYCKLPAYCGINSICSSVSTCTCPTLFSQIDHSDPTHGCLLDTPLNCTIAAEHQFLAVNDVDYYANTHFTPNIVSGPEACTALCLPNCSCTAAFYNNQTGECFLYDTVQTILSGGNPSMTAYLRVAKLPPSPGLSSEQLLSKRAIAGISVGSAFLIVCLLLLSIWTGRRFTKVVDGDESDDEEEAFLESLPGLPPRYSYKELRIATQEFTKKLGKGGSGAVFEGEIDPRPARLRRNQKSFFNREEAAFIKVAVKELEVTERSSLASASKKQFRAEVATLGGLSHINLVQLKGFCAEGSHRLLIYEFLENGSLDRWVFSTETTEVLPWEKRYRIAVDTARGLAFLHEGSRDKVMHLDVKPQNILLDGDFRAKLADFGLAKLMDRGSGEHNQTLTAVRGTPGYMAPEWFLNLPITEKSDVFSYGMVLLELAGGRKNVNLELDSDADDWYFPAWAVKQAENGNLVDIIDKGLRLMSGQNEEMQRECESNMSRLIQVAFWCIQENAASRPSMGTVLLMLEKHVDTPIPPLEHTYVLGRRARPLPMFQELGSSFPTSRMNESGINQVISALEGR